MLRLLFTPLAVGIRKTAEREMKIQLHHSSFVTITTLIDEIFYNCEKMFYRVEHRKEVMYKLISDGF